MKRQSMSLLPTDANNTNFVSPLSNSKLPNQDDAFATLRKRPQLRVETVILLICLWFTAICNTAFWHSLPEPSLKLVIALGLAMTTAHFAFFALLANRWTAKPLLAIISVATAFAAFYMQHYNVYLDPTMLRNILHTDVREASELLTWTIVPPVAAYALPPLLLLWRVEFVRKPLLQAVGFRSLAIFITVLITAGAGMSVYQELSLAMRAQKAARFFLTPSNYLYSLGRAITNPDPSAEKKLTPVGLDATLAASWQQHEKPVLMVLVVGETARAANWGLSGYSRDTTPQLAKENVINFSNVTSCGSSTEVSLPCMFSQIGRHNYDDERIASSESLLHILRRAGFRVVWLDNQSGCKGVCRDIETWRADPAAQPKNCSKDSCFDGAMIAGMEELLKPDEKTVFVIHQLGNHGPAYYRRYPPEFQRFTPTCQENDLKLCDHEEIVNAYDNALLYTDNLLANTIAFLRQHESTHDTAMLYVSDHGESLGENGLYLHGVPYMVAPSEQTHVPMTMWLSNNYAKNFGLNATCLRNRKEEALTHDNLFHTMLGMLDVSTSIYERKFDFTAACKNYEKLTKAP